MILYCILAINLYIVAFSIYYFIQINKIVTIMHNILYVINNIFKLANITINIDKFIMDKYEHN
jgi:hypothetical protein